MYFFEMSYRKQKYVINSVDDIILSDIFSNFN